MDSVSVAPIIRALEELYDKALVEFPPAFGANWPNPLDKPVVVVASRGRKKSANSWYVPSVWKDADDDLLAALAGGPDAAKSGAPARAEIVISSEVLSDPVQTGAELVRQMLAHHRDNLRTENGYASQAWEKVAPLVNCRANINPQQPTKGWTLWTPEPEFRAWVMKALDQDPFTTVRSPAAPYQRKGSKMKKWSCDCTNIRAAVEVVATCAKCKAPFVWAEQDSSNPFEWPFDGGHYGCEACVAARKVPGHKTAGHCGFGPERGPGVIRKDCGYYPDAVRRGDGAVFDPDLADAIAALLPPLAVEKGA